MTDFGQIRFVNPRPRKKRRPNPAWLTGDRDGTAQAVVTTFHADPRRQAPTKRQHGREDLRKTSTPEAGGQLLSPNGDVTNQGAPEAAGSSLPTPGGSWAASPSALLGMDLLYDNGSDNNGLGHPVTNDEQGSFGMAPSLLTGTVNAACDRHPSPAHAPNSPTGSVHQPQRCDQEAPDGEPDLLDLLAINESTAMFDELLASPQPGGPAPPPPIPSEKSPVLPQGRLTYDGGSRVRGDSVNSILSAFRPMGTSQVLLETCQ